MTAQSPPPGFRAYRDRTLLEQDFRSFLTNLRIIHNALISIGANTPPIVTIGADAAFRDLLRLHQVDAPPDGGDVATDHRLMVDAPCGLAKIALRFQWSDPAIYRMTVIFRLPKHLSWLRAALRHGGAWCQPAPLDPMRPALWLPLDSDLLAPHIAAAMTMLEVAEIKRKAA